MEIPLGVLAEKLQGRLEGGSAATPIRGVASLEDAGSGEVSFLANSKYAPLAEKTRAAAVIAAPGVPVRVPAIRVADPDKAFTAAVALFASEPPRPPAGIHPAAVVDAAAVVHRTASVGPFAVVEAGASIGERSVIGPHVFVGAGTRIGDDCHLHPGVLVRERVAIGNRVILHCGVVVGADGFGYATEKGVHRKIPQVGTVQIDDDVEIGANTTVDRARFGKTWIQKGVKIDNLVQVAHNVVIGEHSLVVAQTGLSGSARLGRHVVLAGQTAVAGHCVVGDGTKLGGRGVITKDVGPGSVLSGHPAGAHEKQQKIQALTRRLPRMQEAIRQLQERVDRLDQTAKNDRA